MLLTISFSGSTFVTVDGFMLYLQFMLYFESYISLNELPNDICCVYISECLFVDCANF